MKQAVQQLLEPRIQLVSVTVDPQAARDVFPHVPQYAMESELVHLAGVLLKDSAKLTLNYGIGSRVLRSVPVVISKRHPMHVQRPVVSRFWAQLKVHELSIFPRYRQHELLELGYVTCRSRGHGRRHCELILYSDMHRAGASTEWSHQARHC